MTDAPKTPDRPVPGGMNVLVEFDDGIAWVTLNRPNKRNALSPTLDREEDYLYAKAQETYSTDPEKGRTKGLTQFVDEKSFRPGLGNYRRDEG
jgi:hypothetical protein